MHPMTNKKAVKLILASSSLLIFFGASAIAGPQKLKASPASNCRSTAEYPPCDEDFKQKCKDEEGTMSGRQGWGGMSCWKPLGDSYCKGASSGMSLKAR